MSKTSGNGEQGRKKEDITRPAFHSTYTPILKLLSLSLCHTRTHTHTHYLNNRIIPFESFGKDGVIGIRKGLGADLPCLCPLDLLDINEDAHKLGDGQRRVCVIKLDSTLFVWQIKPAIGNTMAIKHDVRKMKTTTTLL